MKRRVAWLVVLVLMLIPVTAFAEIIRIEDSTTGLVYLYDTVTGSMRLEKPEVPEEPEEPGEPVIPDGQKLEAKDKAGKTWIVVAPKSAQDPFNGATKMVLRPSGKGYKIALVNSEGKDVASKGYVDVYFPLAKGEKVNKVTIGGIVWTEYRYTSSRSHLIMRIQIGD